MLRKSNDSYMNVKKGSVGRKEETAQALIVDLLVKSNALFLYAEKARNANLQAVTHISPSSLKKMRDTALLDKAETILKLFQENINELKEFRMTAQSLQDLQDKVNAYKESLNIKETSLAAGKASRAELTKIFSQIDYIIKKQLDKSIELIKADSKAFYNEYKAARVIRDLGLGKNKPETPAAG